MNLIRDWTYKSYPRIPLAGGEFCSCFQGIKHTSVEWRETLMTNFGERDFVERRYATFIFDCWETQNSYWLDCWWHPWIWFAGEIYTCESHSQVGYTLVNIIREWCFLRSTFIYFLKIENIFRNVFLYICWSKSLSTLWLIWPKKTLGLLWWLVFIFKV